ncbi:MULTISPECIES: hypothetical protein [Cysteiniphilum]|uniref:hypothetical protein n=1 Tax=Cysteiniphilum TaxID=2056696 RepID=UPI001780F555|nr:MULTISPECIES: hypothetical protein [Cysteiniphilum]
MYQAKLKTLTLAMVTMGSIALSQNVLANDISLPELNAPTFEGLQSDLNGDWKTSLEDSINSKADKSELADKVSNQQLTDGLATKADKSELANKADKSELAAKANQADLITLQNAVGSKEKDTGIYKDIQAATKQAQNESENYTDTKAQALQGKLDKKVDKETVIVAEEKKRFDTLLDLAKELNPSKENPVTIKLYPETYYLKPEYTYDIPPYVTIDGGIYKTAILNVENFKKKGKKSVIDISPNVTIKNLNIFSNSEDVSIPLFNIVNLNVEGASIIFDNVLATAANYLILNQNNKSSKGVSYIFNHLVQTISKQMSAIFAANSLGCKDSVLMTNKSKGKVGDNICYKSPTEHTNLNLQNSVSNFSYEGAPDKNKIKPLIVYYVTNYDEGAHYLDDRFQF